MSYIAPNSTIWILAGVPLDPEYVNTTYYDNETQQKQDFEQYRKFTLTEYSYQRADRGYLRVDTGSNHVADDLYNCNYMMFQNTAFGQKWFYAFIRSVEYVANRTALIKYEIDVMQTWMFNYNIPMSLVVREHSLTDAIGDNTIHEEVGIGETYRENEFHVNFDYSSDVYMFFMYVKDTPINITQGMGNAHHYTIDEMSMIFSNVYSGLRIICLAGSFVTPALKQIFYENTLNCINEIISQSGNLVNICEIPKYCFIGGKGHSILGIDTRFMIFQDPVSSNRTSYPFNIYKPTGFSNVNGDTPYIPKNNKLLTSPFITLELTNKEGIKQTYDINKFKTRPNDDRIGFSFTMVYAPSQNYILAPLDYDGASNGTVEGTNPDCFVSGSPLMQPTWTEDTYSSWLAQNKSALVMSVLSTLITSVITIGSGAIANSPLASASGVISGNIGLAQSASAFFKAFYAQDSYHGSMNNDNILTALQIKGFRGCFIIPKKESAIIIDDYFTMYGYAVNSLKIPNCRSSERRPVFNYTQINSCAVIPVDNDGQAQGLPSDDIAIINRIFNKGVREWNSLGHVNRYDLDNSPVNT